MRKLIVAVSCVWFVGCNFGVRTCETTSQCEDGVCMDHFCVLADAGAVGGGGGGATMGGGGGSTGGGGGATDGGPTGGGVATGCSPACAEWESCSPSGCVTARVDPVSPASGTEFSGGETVRFTFRVLDWDGGVWPASTIPATTTGGVTGPAILQKVGTNFEENFVVANTSGMQEVRAGWPAVDAVIRVTARTCTARCAEWQGCSADADGGRCFDLGLSLSWVEPSNGQEFGPAAALSIPLRLNATRPDGGSFAGPIPFVMTGGASGVLLPGAGSWTAAADAGPGDGPRTVTAGWSDGGPVLPRDFVVVATPPTVTLVPQDAGVRSANDTDLDGVARWKKSERALFQVESNRQLAPLQPTDFMVPGVATSTSCTRTCPAASFCQCFSVDLAQHSLVAVAGSIFGIVSVGLPTATDMLGNVDTSIPPAAFPVTRLKWRQDVASSALPFGLAISPTGTVIAGASAGTTSSGLKAFTPDGGTLWTRNYPSEYMTAAPLVGTQGVYFGVTNPTSMSASIRRVGVADGLGQTDPCANLVSQTIWGDMALVGGGVSEVAVAVRSDNRIVTTAGSCVPTAPISPSVGTPSLSNWPSLVGVGTDAFLGMSGGAPIWKFGSADADPPAAAGSKTTTTLFPSNLFAVGTNLVGGGGPTVGGAFAMLTAGTLTGNTVNANPGTSPGGAAIVGGATDAGTVFFGDSAGNLHRIPLQPIVPSWGAPVSVNLMGGVSFANKAPLLGRGGHLYVVGGDGTLRALNATTLVEEWRWDSAVPTTAISQLNLDINRDAAMPCGVGQPGVLYVSASTGALTRLTAILVDSAGLERSAPWPRHQHDPAGTGNPATLLDPWTCP